MASSCSLLSTLVIQLPWRDVALPVATMVARGGTRALPGARGAGAARAWDAGPSELAQRVRASRGSAGCTREGGRGAAAEGRSRRERQPRATAGSGGGGGGGGHGALLGGCGVPRRRRAHAAAAGHASDGRGPLGRVARAPATSVRQTVTGGRPARSARARAGPRVGAARAKPQPPGDAPSPSRVPRRSWGRCVEGECARPEIRRRRADSIHQGAASP